MKDKFSLYIHIPYCSYKCPYCDFNTYAVKQFPEESYINALKAEFSHYLSQPEWADREIETIYFGGGTPSLFSANSLKQFLALIKNPVQEITLEANPGEISKEKLSQFFNLGIKRISFGSQSLNNKILKTLGRKHTDTDIKKSFNNAREVGFKNINLDLIFSVPEQSITDLEKDIEEYISLSPEHISTYELTFEKATPFYVALQKGTLKKPNQDLVVEMYQRIKENLEQAAYIHYETSNFSKPGFESTHNKNYWLKKDYLGLGAGAHSFNNHLSSFGTRFSNLAKPSTYIEQITETGQAISWQEELSEAESRFEFFMLGLRTKEGVNLDEFSKKYGTEKLSSYEETINSLIQQNLLQKSSQKLSLTTKGELLADSIYSEFSNL